MKVSRSRLRPAVVLAGVAFLVFFLLLWWGAGLSLQCEVQRICYVASVTNHIWKPILTLAFILLGSAAISALSFIAMYRENNADDKK
jgi:predicted neutral ceramidase superfamily lipid hydrolase